MSLSPDQIKIKRTTIERGVRIAHNGGGGGDLDSSTLSNSIAAIKQKRDTEKQVLGQLNDRFAKYIERVKFLEGQNKKLLSELDEFREKWGTESRLIRERYEPELLEARVTIDDTTREKAASEIRAKRAEYDAANFKRLYDEGLSTVQADKNKIANLQYLFQENQVELELLRRQKDDTENDIEKYKTEIRRLDEDLRALLADLDQETLRRVKLENEKQTLEEQIPFLNAIHEQEMAELRLLQSGAQLDPTQFYRHELERAIRDIRGDFEELNEQQKRELEEWYKVKTEEIVQQANKRDALDSIVKVESTSSLKSTLNDNSREYNELRQLNADLVSRLGQLEEELDKARHNNGYAIDQREREIAEVRQRLHELMVDYDELMNSKTSLEFEINTYRRLLESEETRTTKSRTTEQFNNRYTQQTMKTSTDYSQQPAAQQQQQQQQAPQQSPNNLVQTPVINSAEMSSKTTFQRSAKGPVSISECSPDGKVIILENTSRNKDIDLTQWLLKRRVDSAPQLEFKFPEGLVLKANKLVRIWARGAGKDQPPSDIINQETDSWGVGINVVTVLVNEQQEEKATHLQKTVYSS